MVEELAIRSLEHKRLEGLHLFFLAEAKDYSEGEWVKLYYKVLHALEQFEREHEEDVILVEVFGPIEEKWQVIWKEARSGSRRPKIRKRHEVKGYSKLFVAGKEKDLLEKFLKELEEEIKQEANAKT